MRESPGSPALLRQGFRQVSPWCLGTLVVKALRSGQGWGDDDLDQAIGVDVLLGGGPDLVGRPGPDGRVVIRIVVGDAVPPSRTEVPELSATLSDRVGDWAAN